MSWWSTLRSVGGALGIAKPKVVPIGCALGQAVFTETKRAAQIVNITRPRRSLQAATIARLKPLFPELDLTKIQIRIRCRLTHDQGPSGAIPAFAGVVPRPHANQDAHRTAVPWTMNTA